MKLTLETRYRYDADTQTQYAPGIYTISDQRCCLRQEEMGFQFHLFRPSEMEPLLQKARIRRRVAKKRADYVANKK